MTQEQESFPLFVLIQISKQFDYKFTIWIIMTLIIISTWMKLFTIFNSWHIKSSKVHKQFIIPGRYKSMAIHEFKHRWEHAYMYDL